MAVTIQDLEEKIRDLAGDRAVLQLQLAATQRELEQAIARLPAPTPPAAPAPTRKRAK